MSPEVSALAFAGAIVFGLWVGFFAGRFDRGVERLIRDHKRHWARLDWNNRVDRRRELKRRFIADKGKSSW